VLVLGCFGLFPAQAQFHGVGCARSYDAIYDISFPAITLTVPGNAQAGDYVGPWHGMYIREKEGWRSWSGPLSFSICTDSGQIHGGGTASKLIPVGVRAPGVYPDPLGFTTADGYSVYTTPTLQSAGLGFAVRWKATNRWGDEGGWVSPSGVWTGEVEDQSQGLPFWRWTVTAHTNAYTVQGWYGPTNLFNSLADWNLFLESYPNPPHTGLGGGYFGIHYDAWVEVRYVAIGPSQQKYVPNDHSVSVNVVRMAAMPTARVHPGVLAKQTVHVKRLPYGTCTTPFHAEVVVGLTADVQDLYTNTVSSTPTQFNLTLLDCPQVDVGFSFRAPAGIDILNETQGIIGLDSTATAQGVGVQLRHSGGWFGNAPIKFNQPGDEPDSSPVYWRDRDDGVPTGQGGRTHVIPLEAAVIRTGGTIIPGSIRASLLVLIQHK